jgi:PEP-CTERM motif
MSQIALAHGRGGLRWIALLSLAGACAAAAADTLYTLPAPSGELETPASLDGSFNAGAGAGSVALQIQGYRSLDGDHYWIDILSVSLNGSPVFSGTWDLGGGGSNRVLLDAPGSAADYDLTNKTVTISLPVTLLEGINNWTVAYSSPFSFESIDRNGPQGVLDEAWGLNSLTINGNSPAAVPEPASATLWLLAAGLLGARRMHAAGRAG